MIKVYNSQNGNATITIDGTQTSKGKSYLLNDGLQDAIQFRGALRSDKKTIIQVAKKSLSTLFEGAKNSISRMKTGSKLEKLEPKERPLTIYEKPIIEELPLKHEVKPPVLEMDEKTKILDKELQAVTEQRNKAQKNYSRIKEYYETKKPEIIIAKNLLDELEARVASLQVQVEKSLKENSLVSPAVKVESPQKVILTNTKSEEVLKSETKPPVIKIDKRLQEAIEQRNKAKKDYNHIKEYYETKKPEIIAAKNLLDKLEKRVINLQGKSLSNAANPLL